MSYTSFNPNLILQISDEAKLIFKIFKQEIRMVGGCVRDLILNRQSNDEDFASSLSPEQIINKLKDHNIHYVLTALKYGTIIAIINKKNFEITTLRHDKQHQGRECLVEHIKQYHLDAKRRDFTINSLYMDDKGLVYDYCNGMQDINNKCIRFIGNSCDRIKEDYLRILRFFRFATQLDFDLDFNGLISCIKYKNQLTFLSKERITNEFNKIIKSNNSSLLKILLIIDHYHLFSSIFDVEIDVLSFKFLCNFPSIEIDDNLKILILFTTNQNDITINYNSNSIIINNKQKKYFRLILQLFNIFEENRVFDNHNMNSNENLIKKILINSIDFDYKIIIDTILFCVAKNKLMFDNLNEVITKIIQTKFISFPLSSLDLISNNFNKNLINLLLKKAKIFWIENDYKNTKDDLLVYLNNINNNR